jgi:predicted lipoprotein with Yx(FWY)xxD motif
MHKILLLSPLLLGALAACSSGASAPPAPSNAAAATHGAVVRVASTSLGKVLVDQRGHTLYLLTADRPQHSTCNTQCLQYWPPVAVRKPMQAKLPGITARIGSTRLVSGGRTLTANGWPLYTFVKDMKPGDVTGQRVRTFGGTWYAVSPAGQAVTAKPHSSSSSSSSGGGSSY